MARLVARFCTYPSEHSNQVCITFPPVAALARCKSGTAQRIALEDKNNV